MLMASPASRPLRPARRDCTSCSFSLVHVGLAQPDNKHPFLPQPGIASRCALCPSYAMQAIKQAVQKMVLCTEPLDTAEASCAGPPACRTVTAARVSLPSYEAWLARCQTSCCLWQLRRFCPSCCLPPFMHAHLCPSPSSTHSPTHPLTHSPTHPLTHSPFSPVAGCEAPGAGGQNHTKGGGGSDDGRVAAAQGGTGRRAPAGREGWGEVGEAGCGNRLGWVRQDGGGSVHLPPVFPA